MSSFGIYLKKVRKDLSLSQSELAVLLHLYDEEFLSITKTVISRWESEKVVPKLPKCLSILRVLKKDLLVFMKSVKIEKFQENPEYIKLLNYRFNINSIYDEVSYAHLETSSINGSFLHPSEPDFIDTILSIDLICKQHDIYKSLCEVPHKFFTDKKISIFRVFDNNTTIGHNIYAFSQCINDDIIIKSSESFPHNLPLCSLKTSEKISIIIFSRYSTNRASLDFINQRMVELLLNNMNIVKIYFLAIDSYTLNYLLSLGANIIKFYKGNSNGAMNFSDRIFIGKKHYSGVFLSLKSELFLSCPHMIKLIKNHPSDKGDHMS